MAAWVRSETSSFAKMALTWLRMVPSDKCSFSAISALEKQEPTAATRKTPQPKKKQTTQAPSRQVAPITLEVPVSSEFNLILGRGHLRVIISPAQVTVDYVRAYLPDDQLYAKDNGKVDYSYTIK